jgi:hypothetical protein
MKRSGRFPLSRFGLLCLFVLSTCGRKEPTSPRTGSFVVENLGVRFGPWDRGTNRAGDFIFIPDQEKVFLEFGARVAAAEGGFKELPTFEYRIRKDAWVVAIAGGRITRLVYQEDTRDYEFSATSNLDPDFEVGYDHVRNLRIGMNQDVNPGDTLGQPGTWNADLGRFEIMINNRKTGLSYCPFRFFNQSTARAEQDRVLQFMMDWERFKGDTTLYDERNQVPPGCLMDSMATY